MLWWRFAALEVLAEGLLKTKKSKRTKKKEAQSQKNHSKAANGTPPNVNWSKVGTHIKAQ